MVEPSVPIGIGLIGLGSWARSAYVPVLQELPGVTVRAVAARTEDTLGLAGRLFGSEVELYTDYNRLVADPNVDAVMIGLPSKVSVPACTAAIQAGKDVWVEPPFPNDAGTRRMLALAVDSPDVFHVDLELRYVPVTDAVKSLVTAGAIGPPLLVRVMLECDWGRRWATGESVGGLSTWYIDAIDALVEEPADRVFMGGAGLGPDSPIQVGTASFRFPGGAIGEWAFNLRSGTDLDLRLRVIGAGGEIEADLLSGSYRHRRLGENWTTGEAVSSNPVHGFVGMREAVTAFLAAVRRERDTLSGPDVYRRVHSMQTAIWRSVTAGTAIRPD